MQQGENGGYQTPKAPNNKHYLSGPCGKALAQAVYNYGNAILVQASITAVLYIILLVAGLSVRTLSLTLAIIAIYFFILSSLYMAARRNPVRVPLAKYMMYQAGYLDLSDFPKACREVDADVTAGVKLSGWHIGKQWLVAGDRVLRCDHIHGVYLYFGGSKRSAWSLCLLEENGLDISVIQPVGRDLYHTYRRLRELLPEAESAESYTISGEEQIFQGTPGDYFASEQSKTQNGQVYSRMVSHRLRLSRARKGK